MIPEFSNSILKFTIFAFESGNTSLDETDVSNTQNY